MSWVPWAISSMGAAFLLMAALGHCARPDGPADTIRTHLTYRVHLPLVMGWIFLVGWLPQALHTPWPLATICPLIALAPAVLISFAARRRAL